MTRVLEMTTDLIQEEPIIIDIVRSNVILEINREGIQGPPGPVNTEIINDSIIGENTVYSSQRVEDRIDEEVGEDDFNFTLLFENTLSM